MEKMVIQKHGKKIKININFQKGIRHDDISEDESDDEVNTIQQKQTYRRQPYQEPHAPWIERQRNQQHPYYRKPQEHNLRIFEPDQ